MKKKMLLSVCAILFASALCANAIEFSKPSLNTLKRVAQPQTTQNTSEENIDTSGTIGYINGQLLNTNSEVQKAYESLFSALLSKEDYNKYQAELKAIQDNPNLSDSEKSAKLMQVATDTSAILENQEKQAEISANLKSLSDEKRAEYINACTSLTNASVQYLALANQCASLGQLIASNPIQAVGLAFELGKIKDTGALLKANLTSIKDVTTKIIAINKANGIDVNLPEDSSGKAKKIDL